MKGSNLSGLLQGRILIAIVQLAPWKLSFCLLRLVTLFYFLANRENRHVIRHNIEEVFAESCAKKEIDLIFRQTLRGIFDHYFENADKLTLPSVVCL